MLTSYSSAVTVGSCDIPIGRPIPQPAPGKLALTWPTLCGPHLQIIQEGTEPQVSWAAAAPQGPPTWGLVGEAPDQCLAPEAASTAVNSECQWWGHSGRVTPRWAA